MPSRRTVKALLAALAVTFAFAVAVLSGALLLSLRGGGDGGIGASAGGVSQRFVALVGLASPLVFAVVFVLLRRSFR